MLIKTMQERMKIMPSGYLIVRASAASGAVPVVGALVTVYNSGDKSEIVATRITDRGGKTDKIELDAPPRQLSEIPDSKILPYSTYDIDITADGYYDSFNYAVPIFDGITSVLPVAMIPLSEFGSDTFKPNIGLEVNDSETGPDSEVN